MSTLYEKIRDLGMEDATIHAHLQLQHKNKMSDFDTAVALIRSLAREKKSYFDHAVKTSQMSVVPLIVPKNVVLQLSLWQRIKIRLRTLL